MININISTLIFQILNFVIMVLVLTRFFFKPVLRILDERSKRVTSALDEAQQREQEAREMHDQYAHKLSEAETHVATMRQQAEEELQATKKSVLEEARSEIQVMREKAENEMQEARQNAIQQHRRELGYLTSRLSGRLMREAGGEAFQQASVEQFLERLAALPAESYRQAAQENEADVLHVQVVSANELGADVLARIEKQAQEMAQKPIELLHKVDPALIAGATMRLGGVVVDGSLAGQLDDLTARYVADLEQG
jgi:F-type H+-transporting ATPase subunit b